MAILLSLPVLCLAVAAAVAQGPYGQSNYNPGYKSESNYNQPAYNQPAPYQSNYNQGPSYKPEPYKSEPYKAEPYKSEPYKSDNYGKSNYGNSSTPGTRILQTGGVISVTGTTGSDAECVPQGTEYYVNSQNELIRVDPAGQFEHTQVKIATYVKYVFEAYDDTTWFLDTYGVIWHVRWQQAPVVIPNQPSGVKWIDLAARTYEVGYAVSENGDVYRFSGNKWSIIGRNVYAKTVATGNDGTVLYGDGQNIFIWDWDRLSWVPFEVNGAKFDIYDLMHVVVCDANQNCQKKLNGKWVAIPDKCADEQILSDSFYCLTVEGKVKLVPYDVTAGYDSPSYNQNYSPSNYGQNNYQQSNYNAPSNYNQAPNYNSQYSAPNNYNAPNYNAKKY